MRVPNKSFPLNSPLWHRRICELEANVGPPRVEPVERFEGDILGFIEENVLPDEFGDRRWSGAIYLPMEHAWSGAPFQRHVSKGRVVNFKGAPRFRIEFDTMNASNDAPIYERFDGDRREYAKDLLRRMARIASLAAVTAPRHRAAS